MIGSIWPWARVAPQGRTFLWLAILLISASGLIAGLAAHSISHGGGGTTSPGTSGTTTATPTAGIATATLAPAVTTPQKFAITFDVPTPAAHGETLTIITHAIVADKFDSNGLPIGAQKPAQGVVCQLTFLPAGSIPLPAMQTTDVSGTASFAIALPATTPPCTYTVHVHATWGTGGFAANREVLVKIT